MVAKKKVPAKPKKKIKVRGRHKGVSPFQVFIPKRRNRKEIKGAPYNPRVIDEIERKKLRKSLDDLGLVDPLIYNIRTGNLISGHQRTKLLDALHGTDDYILDYMEVDVSKEKEVEMNIALNQKTMTGEYDDEKLVDLKKLFPEVDFKIAGFDDDEINYLFPKTELEELVTPEGAIDALNDFEQMELSEEEMAEQKRKEKERIERFNKLKEQDNESKENTASFDSATPDFYVMIVFSSPEEKHKFDAYVGLMQGESYVNFSDLQSHLKHWKED